MTSITPLAPLAGASRRGESAHEIGLIRDKVLAGERIDAREALYLHDHADLLTLGELADHVRRRKHPESIVTYIVDRNLNPTNVCITDCGFCAFYRRPDAEGAYVLPREEIFFHAVRGSGSRIVAGETSPAAAARVAPDGRRVLVSHDLPAAAVERLLAAGFEVRPASGGAISVKNTDVLEYGDGFVLEVKLVQSSDSAKTDIFVEGFDAAYFRKPELVTTEGDTQTYHLKIDGIGAAKDLSGHELMLTIVDGKAAVARKAMIE